MTPGGQRRILFLGHGAERTGPPLLLASLVRWLGAHANVTIDIALARGGPLVAEYEAAGANVRLVTRLAEPAEPALAALRRIGRPHDAAELRQRLTQRRLRDLPNADLVVINSISTATLGLLRALPPGHGPVVAWVHELDIALRHGLESADHRLLMDQPSHYVAVADAVAENLRANHHIPADKIVVQHGWVDANAIDRTLHAGAGVVRGKLGLAPDAFVIGSIGLPDWRKAPELLLHAAAIVRQRRPDINLHVVWVGGDPATPTRWQMDDEAHRLGLADRWHFHRHEDNPDRWLGVFDVFALPAREDAFPLAALEAAAAERPIVSFASGGIVELTGDDAGVVVPYPDTEAMATAFIDLFDNPDRRKELGVTARARVLAHHDVSTAAPALWAHLDAWSRGTD